MISGATTMVGLVGHPVVQVKMPGFLNPHFERMGQDAAVVPFDVPSDVLAHYVGLLRHADNFLGTLVTVPHKQAFARLVDGLTDRARALGAVNVVRRDPNGSLHGDHLDGLAFLAASRRHGFTPAGRSALVVGVGGAGSAIAHALAEAGVRVLCILEPDEGRQRSMRRLLERTFPAVQIHDRCSSLAGFDLVVNATAIGMHAGDPMPIQAELLATLAPSTLVADVVTLPEETALLHFARARGCRIQKGAEMTKAAMAYIGAFLGVMPPEDPLSPIPTTGKTKP